MQTEHKIILGIKMAKNFYVNGTKVLSKKCDKDAAECPVMQHIALNKFVQNTDGDNVRLLVFYTDTVANNLKTICKQCSKQKE